MRIFRTPKLLNRIKWTRDNEKDDSPPKEPAKTLKMVEREQIKQGQEPLMEMMKQLMEEMKQLREENGRVKKELQTINEIGRKEWKEKERNFEERINNLEKKLEKKEKQKRRLDALGEKTREKRKGRAKGGIITGVKKDIKEIEEGAIEIEGMVERKPTQEEEEKIKAIRTEQEAWQYINKERKNKITISEDIPIIQWKKYFMELLNGKEERIVVKDSKTGNGGREREAEIRVEEVGKQVGRLKRRKAPGRDGLVNEV
ncbi:golgin subfamily A member 6-like protein 25 [Zophobas morio]|uniref:golgin subfamily A member 6-like protein 25 n=1 Tax=Zophobas morio TaxID=2755281 RepID=UPI003083ADB2